MSVKVHYCMISGVVIKLAPYIILVRSVMTVETAPADVPQWEFVCAENHEHRLAH